MQLSEVSKLVTVYEVKPEPKAVLQQANQTVIEGNSVTAESPAEEIEVENNPAAGDNYYDIMLQCYRDAQNIHQELNGFGDAEKIAVTLFIARSKNM